MLKLPNPISWCSDICVFAGGPAWPPATVEIILTKPRMKRDLVNTEIGCGLFDLSALADERYRACTELWWVRKWDMGEPFIGDRPGVLMSFVTTSGRFQSCFANASVGLGCLLEGGAPAPGNCFEAPVRRGPPSRGKVRVHTRQEP